MSSGNQTQGPTGRTPRAAAPDRVAAALTAFARTDAEMSASGRWGAMTEYLLSAADLVISGFPFQEPMSSAFLENSIRLRDQYGTPLREDEFAGALLAILAVAGITVRAETGDVRGQVTSTIWAAFQRRWADVVSHADAAAWVESVVGTIAAGEAEPPAFLASASNHRSMAPASAFLAAGTDPGCDSEWIGLSGFDAVGRQLLSVGRPSVGNAQGGTPLAFRRTEVSLSATQGIGL